MYLSKVKKILLAMGMMPLLWCCDGSGERKTADSGTDTVATTSAAPTPTSERIATMTEEVRMLMEQFGENPDPKLLQQAMSINDSIERLDTTQQGRFNTALTRAQLLAMSGNMLEAMEIQERLLSNNPDDFVRLQFYAGKYRMEGKLDSMNIYAERALSRCDKVIADSADNAVAVDQALMNKINIYQILDNRSKAKEANDQLASRHKDDPDYQLTDEEFNEEYNAARASLNQSAEAYRKNEKEMLRKSEKEANRKSEKEVHRKGEKEKRKHSAPAQ